MAKKTPIERFEAELQQILEEYGAEVSEGTAEAVKEITQKTAKAVRGNARGSFGGKGAYAKAWTFEVEEGRLKNTGIVYNRMPGLPHLLEKGHAKRGGGRVPGRAHIAPAEEEAIEAIQKAIEEAAK
jgi:hypothetical protein